MHIFDKIEPIILGLTYFWSSAFDLVLPKLCLACESKEGRKENSPVRNWAMTSYSETRVTYGDCLFKRKHMRANVKIYFLEPFPLKGMAKRGSETFVLAILP